MVGFQLKFDLHWLNNVSVHIKPTCRVWDCSLAEFILSGQQARFISLNESLESYGEPRKPDLVADYWARGISTENIPLPILDEYNRYDVDGTARLQQLQQELMSPEQINLCYLMGEDLKTLQHAEYHGIKWDANKAREKLVDIQSRLDVLEHNLRNYLPVLPVEIKFNWDSGDQLSAFLYGGEIEYEYGIPQTSIFQSGPKLGEVRQWYRWERGNILFQRIFEPIKESEVSKTRGNPSAKVRFYQTDEPTLKQLTGGGKVGRYIRELILERSRLSKISEMVQSIQKKATEMNWQDNYIHGQFNQNIVITGRLSSSGPNLQNTPEEVDELLISRYDS